MKSTTVCAFFVLLEIVAAQPTPVATLSPVPVPTEAPTPAPTVQITQQPPIQVTTTLDIDCANYDRLTFINDMAQGLNVDIARLNIISAVCDTPSTNAPGQVGRFTVVFEIFSPTAVVVADPQSEPSQDEVEADLMTQLACDTSLSVASCPIFGGALTSAIDPGSTRIIPFCEYTICPTGQWCHVDHCEIACTIDDDCPANDICQTATSHCQTPCTSSTECGTNEWCHGDHCERNCVFDSDCSANGVCVMDHCRTPCSVAADCLTGEWCHETMPGYSHCEVNCLLQPCGSGQVCNPMTAHCEMPRPCEETCGLVREECHRNPNCAMALMAVDHYRIRPEPPTAEPVPGLNTVGPTAGPAPGQPGPGPAGQPGQPEPEPTPEPPYTPVPACDPQNWSLPEHVDACWSAAVRGPPDMHGQWMFNEVASCMDCCQPQPTQICQASTFDGSGDQLSVRCQNQCYPQLVDCMFEDSSNCNSVLQAISDGSNTLCSGDTTATSYDSTLCWDSVTGADGSGRLEFDELQECHECCESSVCDVCATECAVQRSGCTGQCDAVYTAIETRDPSYPTCARELFDDEDAIMNCFSSVSGGMDLVGFLDLMLLLQCEKCCHEPWCDTECGSTCHGDALACYSNTNCMAAMDEIEIAGPGTACHNNEMFDWQTCWTSLYPTDTDGQDEFEDLLQCHSCCGHPECDARRECQVECAAELGACTGNCFVAAIAINDMNYPNCAFDLLTDTEDCWESVLPNEIEGRCEFDNVAECFGCCNAPFDFQNGRYLCPFDAWQAEDHTCIPPPPPTTPEPETPAPTTPAPTQPEIPPSSASRKSFVLASLVATVVSVMLTL